MKEKPVVLLWEKLMLLALLPTVTTVSSFSEYPIKSPYYVIPTPDTPCPGEPCHTLSQYAEQYYWNNISSSATLVFLPGDHTLNVTISMGSVSNYTVQLNQASTKYVHYSHPSLTLLGNSSFLPEVTSRIVCTWPAGFAFAGISELHIKALAFISCGHNDSAAVNILSVQNIYISNSTFQDNTNNLYELNANDKQGGAVYVCNSRLTLTDNTFQNNSADNGGALFAYTNNTLTLSGNTFQNNSAVVAGALCVAANNTLTLSGNTFQNNFAYYNGSALFAYTNNTLTLSGNTFQNNFAVVAGALCAVTNNTLTLSGNTFQNNFAYYNGSALFAYTNNTLTLSGNTFQNNFAYYNGSALFADTNNTLTLSGNTFQNNSADEFGGALVANTNNIITLSKNIFQNNSATYIGGALCVYTNNILTLTNNTFQNNSADQFGGAIYAYTNNTLTLSVNTFQNNSANYIGGALFAYTNNTLTLSGNTFQNSSAAVVAGALCVAINNTLTLSENTFQNNFARVVGALFADTNNTLTLSGNTFQNNSADEVGGALVANTNNIITLSNNTFQNNSATYIGGALCVYTNNIITLSNNTFQNNSADNGGALYVATNNTLTLSGNTFQNNSATYIGGALFSKNNNSITLSGNIFQNNSAANDGGAPLAYTNNTLTLSGNTIQNNSAAVAGALFAHTNNTLTLSGNIFQNNSAASDGGALFANTNNTLTLSGNTFQSNSADEVGGALVANTSNILTLSNNTFQNNSATYIGGALCVYTNNILTLTNNTFQNSSADQFGGAIYVFTNNNLTLSVNIFQNNSVNFTGGALLSKNNNSITLSGNTFQNNSAANDGGALVSQFNTILTLSANTFQNNFARRGGGGALFGFQSTMHLADNILTGNMAQSGGGAIFLQNSTLSVYGSNELQNNTSQYGGGIAALDSQIVLAGDMLFKSNKANFGGGLYTDQSHVSGSANFSSNSAMADGGAIYASRSTFHMEELITVFGNSALNGGGLLFTEGSKLYLKPNTTINFTNNLVTQKGGAIKVENSNHLSNCAKVSCALLLECFIRIETQKQYDFYTSISNIIELHNVRIYFQNNTALEAGGTLYGGSVDNCRPNFIRAGLIDRNSCLKRSSEMFNYITNSDEIPLNISSDPLYICTCKDGEPDCSASVITRSVYPGGTIQVPVIAYGQSNGTTPAVIHNLTPRSNITIPEPENTRNITKECTFLNYTVQTHAVRTNQEMTLYAQGTCPPNERTVPSVPTNVVKVHVSILPCPPGFELLQEQPACNCAQRLQRFTKLCRIDDRTIERDTEFWVGYVSDNTSDGLILHPHCPFDYCTPNKTYIAVNDSDEQCNNYRTGLLCGECTQNFSLALGTNRCLQCSNDYLWLIVAFAFAGVALVLLLLALRLTVAVGTIHGLLFYANIFSVNSALFVRAQTPVVLTVFIAWLNLDLGFETCFYNGMDVYTKTWLQFVFPVYVWALVGIIIVVGHYSAKVATILGNNPIAVLATLFLLSYAKFLRTIIASLSYTLLEYPDNSTIAVWLYDGNIGYLSNKHVPLFTAALVCLILLFLPYTLFLMFSQWLRSKSGYWKIFHWVNHYRVLPFLDAYHAPYTDKYRYWTGLMLLVRCILFLLFAFNALGDPSVNLLAICSVTSALIIVYVLFQTRIYKTWYLNVLEVSFIANLCVLSLATLFIRSAGGNQNAVTITSISAAFATFFGIVTYHSAQQMKHAPRLWRKVFPRDDTSKLVSQTDEDSDLSPPSPPDPSDGCATVTHINFRELLDLDNDIELREPCMEMTD